MHTCMYRCFPVSIPETRSSNDFPDFESPIFRNRSRNKRGSRISSKNIRNEQKYGRKLKIACSKHPKIKKIVDRNIDK